MTVIEGAVHTLRTLVDGTLAIVVHIEPRNRKLALELLADPGTPVAVAALSAEAEQVEPQAEPVGPLALWAIQRCREPEFQEWIRPVYDRAMGGRGHTYGDLSDDDIARMGMEGFARHALLVLLRIESRRDIDTPANAALFHQTIRKPYMAWLEAQR